MQRQYLRHYTQEQQRDINLVRLYLQATTPADLANFLQPEGISRYSHHIWIEESRHGIWTSVALSRSSIAAAKTPVEKIHQVVLSSLRTNVEDTTPHTTGSLKLFFNPQDRKSVV